MTEDQNSRLIRKYLKENAQDIKGSLSQRMAQKQFQQLFELLSIPLDGLDNGLVEPTGQSFSELRELGEAFVVSDKHFRDDTIFGLGREWFNRQGLPSDQGPKDFLQTTTNEIIAQLRGSKSHWLVLGDVGLASLAGLWAARQVNLPVVLQLDHLAPRTLEEDHAWAVLSRKILRVFLQEVEWAVTDDVETAELAIRFGVQAEKLVDSNGVVIKGTRPLDFAGEEAAFIANDSSFKATNQDKKLATRYRQLGEVHVRPHKPVSLPLPPTYWEDPFNDANWRFSYHTFRWADVLRREYLRTGNEELKKLHILILKRWARTCLESNNHELISHVWSDMGAAIRSRSVALALHTYGYDPELVALLHYHLEWLKDPAHWPARGNHLLHVYRALYAMGHVLNDLDTVAKARALIFEYLRNSISPEGEDFEGSLMYQRSNMSWAKQVVAEIEACASQAVPDDIQSRIAKMANVIAYATDYGGYQAQYGDSNKHKGPVFKIGDKLPVADEEHTTIRGLHVYPRAGLGFIRSEQTENPEHNVFAMLRAYPPGDKQVHAHSDHGQVLISFGGTQVLQDSGRYTYGSNPRTWYLKSVRAHSVAVATNREDRQKTVRGDFTYQIDDPSFRAIAVSAQYDETTRWHRTLCVHSSGDIDIYDY
ncbi:heparinase II/III domain-containing protein [Micrococcoides hystricis]|uniref:Heparinase II/III family protein n=1 Tax=Micrococcoides hystricis TaxID=1572761 RepID=A0ABV6PE23_9MICC